MPSGAWPARQSSTLGVGCECGTLGLLSEDREMRSQDQSDPVGQRPGVHDWAEKCSELPLDIFDAVTDMLEPFFHVFSASFDALANLFGSVHRSTVRPF